MAQRRYTPGMYAEKPEKGRQGGPRQQYLEKQDLRLKLYAPHDGQKKLHMSPARFRIACAGRRWGKQLALDTPLPTPQGWTTMGAVKVGDELYDEMGSICIITGVEPIDLAPRSYRVVFDDGTSIVACAEHLWSTWDKPARKNYVRSGKPCWGPKVRSTEEIVGTLLHHRKDGAVEHNHSIPVAQPLQGRAAILLIDPYLLGAWLGDGDSRFARITIADDDAEEMLGYLADAGAPQNGSVSRKDGARCANYGVGSAGSAGIVRRHGFSSKLTALSLMQNKHIPGAYLRAHVLHRVHLLMGLMDTDGYLENGRHAEITQKNERLALGILELVRSLGMKPTMAIEKSSLDGRDCGLKYRISFTPNRQVFRLRRKASQWVAAATRPTVTSHRRIISVERVDPVPMRCITVDSPSHLYLAGEGMVPTHNTIGCVNELAKYGWEHPELPSWWVAPTYGQAVKAFTTATDNFGTAIKQKRAAQGQMQITWQSGGRTRFLSAERYENLRGEGVGFMVVDEAAFVSRAAWQEVLRPMLSDTMGRAILISTPKGRNWFYEMYLRGEDPEEVEYESFWFPTISSPYVADSEVEEARRTLPADVFAQEYEAAFLSQAAGVFHNIDECVYGEYKEPETGHRYAIGWDVAKHSDFSVIHVVDTDGMRIFEKDGKIHQVPTPQVVHFDRFNTLSYALQIDKVEAIAKKYGAYVLMDATGLGDPIYDTLQARGVPVYPYHMSTARKTTIIQNLAVALETQGVAFPANRILEHELAAYMYEITPAGTIRYSAPEGDHDDCVISLALGVWAAQHPVWLNEPKVVWEPEESISPI